MRPKIRPMTSKDKPAIIQILRNIPEFKPAEVDVAEEVIDSYIQEPTRSGYEIFVAEVGSSIAGYICYGPTPLTEGTWDIYWLAVNPKQQGQGIGKALLPSPKIKSRRLKADWFLLRHHPSRNMRQQGAFTAHKAMNLLAALPTSMRPAMINFSSKNG